MAEDFVKQHIVPKRYLDRFAESKNNKKIIGTRMLKNGQVILFLESTSEVGYVRNIYDVTDKEDPKYWEHFLNIQVDSLCGTELQNIISAITLSRNRACVLSETDKGILSKLIVAQMMRVPSSIDHIKTSYPRIEKKVKEEAKATLPSIVLERFKDTIDGISLSEQRQKELYLNLIFDPANFEKYCDILKNRLWAVYVNTIRNSIPFVTSDNPVLIEGIGKSTHGVFHNGLADPATCILYPISPSIVIANYGYNGIVGLVASELDSKKTLIDDLKFITVMNTKIMEQAYQHSFIPQPLFDEIKN